MIGANGNPSLEYVIQNWYVVDLDNGVYKSNCKEQDNKDHANPGYDEIGNLLANF